MKLMILVLSTMILGSIAMYLAAIDQSKKEEAVLVNAVMNDGIKSVTFYEYSILKRKYPQAYAHFTRHWVIKY